MNKGQKREIDEMPYESMLRINRTEPLGSRRFLGEKGEYFLTVMNRKRREVGDEFHSQCSKRIGW